MPLHDWSAYDNCGYHDFELGWLVRLSSELNKGLLPSSHYALNETLELRPQTGYVTYPEPEDDRGSLLNENGESTDAEVRYSLTDERPQYAARAVVIRSTAYDQPVAAIHSVTRQDMTTPYRREAQIRLAAAALSHGIHLVVLEPFVSESPTQATFAATLWHHMTGLVAHDFSPKPVAFASFESGRGLRAVVESIAVGETLPALPLFLGRDSHIMLPLEESYTAAFRGIGYPVRDAMAATLPHIVSRGGNR